MVNCIYLSLFILFGSLSAAPSSGQSNIFDKDLEVSSTIDADEAYENRPLRGMITVAHNQNVPVDVNSFRLDKMPLSVTFVKNIQINPNNPLVLTIYHFYIPAQPAGSYVLPPVTVNVGGQIFQSISSFYDVQAGKGN